MIKENKRRKLKKFESTHRLDFMACPWPRNPKMTAYRVGTCDGIYDNDKEAYNIIAVVNNEPGNGHFEDVLEWFEQSCRRDHKALRFVAILNEGFRKHLVDKRGFKHEGRDNVIKYFE